MNTNEYGEVDVTKLSLRKMAQVAYEMSVPVGMGFLHARPGPLSDEDADACIRNGQLSMDYVHGRCCKFRVRKDNKGHLWAPLDWYDHSVAEMTELLRRCGVEEAS